MQHVKQELYWRSGVKGGGGFTGLGTSLFIASNAERLQVRANDCPTASSANVVLLMAHLGTERLPSLGVCHV